MIYLAHRKNPNMEAVSEPEGAGAFVEVEPQFPLVNSVQRIHFMDGLRAVLMLLGIPYHSAIIIAHRSEGPGLTTLAALADFIHVWRMPAFFVIAGFFALLIVRRRGAGEWFVNRLQRLGIPLLFGIAFISPLQMAILGDWDRLSGSLGQQWLYHLWFLLVLLIYCALVALAFRSPLRRSLGKLAGLLVDWFASSFVRTMVAASTLGLGTVAGIAVWQAADATALTRRLLDTGLIFFAPFFALGMALALRPLALPRLQKNMLPVAVAAVALHFVCQFAPDTPILSVADIGLLVVGGFACTIVLFSWADRVFTKRSILIDWLVDSSLVVYIVHHPFIFYFAGGLAAVPPFIAFSSVFLLTIASSFVVYEFVNRVPLLRLLMTGRSTKGTDLARVLARKADVAVIDGVT